MTIPKDDLKIHCQFNFVIFTVRGPEFIDGEINPVFRADNFTKFIVPQLCQILNLRDASIRLVLLHFFSHYVEYIPKSILQRDILPKVLLGLKDTNDVLVAASLRALADMVPILGGSVVVGINQSKLFTDALPKVCMCIIMFEVIALIFKNFHFSFHF